MISRGKQKFRPRNIARNFTRSIVENDVSGHRNGISRKIFTENIIGIVKLHEEWLFFNERRMYSFVYPLTGCNPKSVKLFYKYILFYKNYV